MQPIRSRRVPTPKAPSDPPVAPRRWVSVDQVLSYAQELQEAQGGPRCAQLHSIAPPNAAPRQKGAST